MTVNSELFFTFLRAQIDVENSTKLPTASHRREAPVRSPSSKALAASTHVLREKMSEGRERTCCSTAEAASTHTFTFGLWKNEAGAQTILDVVHLGSQHGDKGFRIDQHGNIVLLDYFIKLALRRDEVKGVAVV